MSNDQQTSIYRMAAEHIRRLCIAYMNQARPTRTATGSVLLMVQKFYPNTGAHQISRELDYLALKGLISISDSHPQLLSLTAAGVEMAEEIEVASGLTTSPRPHSAAIKLSARDLAILSDFTGQNHRELASKYGVSLQKIYKIVKSTQQEAALQTKCERNSHLTAPKVRCRHCRLLTTKNANGSREPWCAGLGVFRHPEQERVCEHFAPTYYFETELRGDE